MQQYATQLDLMRDEGILPEWVENFVFLSKIDPRNPSREYLAERLDRVPAGDEDTVLQCALHLSPSDYEGLVEKAKRITASKPRVKKFRRTR